MTLRMGLWQKSRLYLPGRLHSGNQYNRFRHFRRNNGGFRHIFCATGNKRYRRIQNIRGCMPQLLETNNANESKIVHQN